MEHAVERSLQMTGCQRASDGSSSRVYQEGVAKNKDGRGVHLAAELGSKLCQTGSRQSGHPPLPLWVSHRKKHEV
eukprot:CAMPEP_0204256358 /NCGR_PEP_ID=MMETSP0468-20130131/3735_1 /ASSEMBLY_ACC=CAM_ASM_000383 /TAXON_ID=2969 /ORGANISM="Oxyrrhis marina" /LENGTH=74 /DNA_ID=CAMNT_0051230309 /DNA_START=157 /DNA_END=382 /DNA_ORIENTATION=+